MSRSIKKTIAWGKSNNGGNTRHTKTRGDYSAEKARKENMPIRPQHVRAAMQTLQDYIDYVSNDCNTKSRFCDKFDRKNFQDLMSWISENGDSAASMIEFARKLYNRDKSK